MAQPILMPKMGQSQEDCAIVKWRFNVGDAVKKGDILFEVETEKAVLEVESFYDGSLLGIVVPAGQPVPIGTTVAFVGQPGEKFPDVVPPPRTQAAAPKAEAAAPVKAAAPPTTPAVPKVVAPQAPSPAPAVAPSPAVSPAAPSRRIISPRARTLAESSAISIDPIAGSGPGGRIVEKDVKAYLAANHYDALRVSPAAKTMAIRQKVDILTVRGTGDSGRIMVGDVERSLKERPRALSKMRQIIAQRLTHSVVTAPHFFVTVDVDMTDLLDLRKQAKENGKAYSVTDFILEAVVLSLQEHPVVNSTTDGKNAWWHGAVHLGVATSLPDGLVVPVVRNADTLSLVELHNAVADLSSRARDNKLLPEEMTGSTFTVSNMGMLNVENFTAIINPGESAILAVSSTQERAVVRSGKVIARSMMKLTLSSDHRLIDGAAAVAFSNSVKTKLEDMQLWKSLM